MRVYLASAYRNGHLVDTMIKPSAEARGLVVASTWHIGALPPDRLHSENLEAMSLSLVRRIADTNDRDLAGADGVLVLWHHECGETFAELRHALHLGKPVAYVGPRFILSAYREGVQRFSHYGDALTWLAGRLRDRLPTSAEPDFSAVFKPSDRPDTLPARADEEVERELAAVGGAR